MRTDAAWALAAYAAAVVSTPVTQVSDAQALVFGFGSGIAGGVLAGLMSTKPSGHEYLLRMIACGLGAPSLVWFGYLQGLETLTLYPVAASSGLAGLLAWPALNLLRATVEKISPKELRAWIARAIGGPPAGGDK